MGDSTVLGLRPSSGVKFCADSLRRTRLGGRAATAQTAARDGSRVADRRRRQRRGQTETAATAETVGGDSSRVAGGRRQRRWRPETAAKQPVRPPLPETAAKQPVRPPPPPPQSRQSRQKPRNLQIKSFHSQNQSFRCLLRNEWQCWGVFGLQVKKHFTLSHNSVNSYCHLAHMDFHEAE